MPSTPVASQCQPGSNWSSPEHNWCQLPWCYVSSECVYKIPSRVFNGSTAFFSYEICGKSPDCYNEFMVDAACPFDPHGTTSYVLHKGSGCECVYHGGELPSEVYQRFPLDQPGRYENLTYIKLYGTSCAAWDQVPETPWFQYCPMDSDWCNSTANWCQLPWCYVGSNCSSRVASTVFAGSEAAFHSYDTCLSTPDCSSFPFDLACPFDRMDNGWSTPTDCPDSWSDVCECVFQGDTLPEDVYANYPFEEPGKYSDLPNIAVYGTSCAAWDQIPGTPLVQHCRPGSNWSASDFNWCQIPWCYVNASCASRRHSMVFNGSNTIFFSYDSCGNAPDCYNQFDTDPRCPFDPYGSHHFMLHKGRGCECLHHGRELPPSLWQDFPSLDPGKYAGLPHVTIYGTSCAAWDQVPGTPWAPYCPQETDWCHSENNWCQLPWCYVRDSCSSGLAGKVFEGAMTFFSYDTCLSTPQCYMDPFDESCPFDMTDTGWSTPSACPHGWSDVCSCMYQGSTLPEPLYLNYPRQDPGRYAHLANVALYGTSCATWDRMPETPFASFCPPGSHWSSAAYNWCNLPWCYVDSTCPSRHFSAVFNGSRTAWYSYDTCGNTPNCYDYFLTDERCPYDPYGAKSYVMYKGNGCECLYTGMELPSEVYQRFPLDQPGRYENLTYIKLYGTSCAAWDQVPETPWFQYCPMGSDWCNSANNWCQLPWCYVGSNCSSRVASTVFAGSEAAFHSYDTCLSTPDCRSFPFDPACPFDSKDSAWSTAADCPDSWSNICECKYQGTVLPAPIYMNFPVQEPGRYAELPHITVYGTACAAWDQLPGTPFAPLCPPGSDWSHSVYNWCQLPWCYVDPDCVTARTTSVFNGSTMYYSYDACGNAPDCYNDFAADARCPWDPYNTKMYRLHKAEGCECIHAGQELPLDAIQQYPMSEPGKYANLSFIRIYGTSCGSWDTLAGGPWSDYCLPGSDWCSTQSNWCQIPWCFVGSACASRIRSTLLDGPGTRFYSYDTCLSAPNCRNTPYDASCPFDSTDNGWSSAARCPDSWSDVCKCIYQGDLLPSDIYSNFPSLEPGRWATLQNVPIYGSTCAPWDVVPQTPQSILCPPGSDWTSESYSWCQLPWCYVSSNCVTKIATRVFEGADLWYSYDTCGNAPDCYNHFSTNLKCPYDPYGSMTYMVHKGGDCACRYHGYELPFDAYTRFPTREPGKYQNMPNIAVYGTTCASWDQVPNTPSYCPDGVDWCHSEHNWCQLPWCYVGVNCSTKLASAVFQGSEVAYYSYDTCLSAPDCYNEPFDPRCPYDSNDAGWSTTEVCPDGWSDLCHCMYQGDVLPEDVYTKYPTQEPGKYMNLSHISLYGTSCASWDQVPGTPWAHLCPPGSDWSAEGFNWCQVPWCYVSNTCKSRIRSSVFDGSSTLFYSYDVCGNAPDCYNDFAGAARCPFDPTRELSYALHKGHGCECLHHGMELPAETYLNYPIEDPGKYASLFAIKIYGTSCAAWDQMPATPWASYCPVGADWCHSDNNWCQLPWCYVGSSCTTKLPTSVFNGSATMYYSYDTCFSTPNCRLPLEPGCPYDSTVAHWATGSDCPHGWSDVCDCVFQGSTLPEDMYLQYPVSSPGMYKNRSTIALYGTSCAAWDVIPGTPLAGTCLSDADYEDQNWCQVPWCFVSSACPSQLPSRVFSGSGLVYSYDTCGNAPDCYNSFEDSKCPFDPYGTQRYTLHKSNGCECLFHGRHLPNDVYMMFPAEHPGMYSNLSHISVYGTACAAWDQMPGTPWAPLCPAGVDWCSSTYNWCQLSWCFVSSECETALPSTVFHGSTAGFYSYDTCMSMPDCLSFPYDPRCPFDKQDLSFSTAADCPLGWTDTPGVPITSFDAALMIDDVWSFKEAAYRESVQSSTGLSSQQVLVDSIQFRISVPYALLWASVQIDDEQMAAAVASAGNLDPSKIKVSSSRRLSDFDSSEEASERRLQNLFQISAFTDNAADLTSMQSKLANTATLQSSLASMQIQVHSLVT